MNLNSRHIAALAALIIMTGCANRGSGPQGGPKDVLPPKPGEMTPKNNATNVNTKKFTLNFDEFVEVKSASQNVIVSPPQKIAPTILANGKKVTIELADSLIPNTTYTIDFTNSLCDLNEGNVLEGFTYAFSTGDMIDTMQVKGQVLDAENLNPLAGVQVGIYETGLKGDSTGPLYQMPMRITRTDSTGHFTIKNVKNGAYDIYALEDKNSDFILAKGEKFGFIDNSIQTAVETKERYDTTKVDTALIRVNSIKKKKERKKQLKELNSRPDSLRKMDSVTHVVFQHYTPDSLVILASARPTTQQKVSKTERPLPFKVGMYFLKKNIQKRPDVVCINNPSASLLKSYSKNNDSISIWIPDTVFAETDSLRFQVTYQILDSLDQFQDKADTVKAFFGKKQLSKYKKADKVLAIKANAGEMLPFYMPLDITFDRPVSRFDTAHIRLFSAEDTVWTQVPLPQCTRIEIDSTVNNGQEFFSGLSFKVEWDPELKYTVKVDSAAALGLGGIVNNKFQHQFKITGPDKYANLNLKLVNGGTNPVVQLLNEKDEVVMEKKADGNGTLFEHLGQGDYYLRLYDDENNDGEWTPGVFKDNERSHAEKVKYLNTKVHLRANWDVDQEWDADEVETEKQKPAELKSTNSNKK